MDAEDLAHDLMSPDVQARRQAAKGLARRGADASIAAPALVRAAGDKDDSVREWAVAALEDLGPPRAADLSAVAELLQGTPADTAYWAATLIGRCETAAATCVGPLLEALQTRREMSLRERIVWALGRMGPDASPASTAIEAAFRAPDCPRRLARLCREALQSIDPPPANV